MTKHRPWQFDWKRPLWQRPTEPSNVSFKHANPVGTTVSHAAAALHPQEVMGLAKEEEDPPVPSLEQEPWVLTVTLVQSPTASTRNLSQKTAEGADTVLLQVIKPSQKNSVQSESNWLSPPPPPSLDDDTPAAATRTDSVVVASRLLRWPKSAFVESHHHEDDVNDKDDSATAPTTADTQQKSNPFLLPWMHRALHSSSSSSSNAPGGSTSLVAACLCRLAPDDPTAAADQARHVLEELALLTKEQDPETTSPQTGDDAQEEEQDAAQEEAESIRLSQEVTDLVLVCLSTAGKVYVYSPWKLLGLQQPHAATSAKSALEQESESEDDDDGGVASLLFGKDLWTTLQQTVLPLSQPLKTIRLSVQGRLQDVDPASRVFATRQNRLTHCLTCYLHANNNKKKDAGSALLCVAGKGRRRRTKKRNRQGRRRTNSSNSSVVGMEPTVEEEEPSESSEFVPPRAASSRDDDDGGFLIFLSLRTFAVVRIVYLPFVPEHISPCQWGTMSFCMVIGQGKAVAIRIDTQSVQMVHAGEAPSHGPNLDEAAAATVATLTTTSRLDKKKKKKKSLGIRRFQVLPIQLPIVGDSEDKSLLPLMVASSQALPPALGFLDCSTDKSAVLLQRTLQAVQAVSRDETDRVFDPYLQHTDTMTVILTEHASGELAHIGFEEDAKPAVWCHLGQGWGLVGVNHHVYFVCFQGATVQHGAFVYELDEEEADLCGGRVSSVLPVFPYSNSLLEEHMSKEETAVPLSFAPYSDEKPPTPKNDMDHDVSTTLLPEEEALDTIVVEAMQSISSINFREDVESSPQRSPRRKSKAYTHREKSERLVRKCSSWTQLEKTGHRDFEVQMPAVSVRLGSKRKSGTFLLSLRKSAGESPAAAFQHVLAWLSDSNDYFTAASLALDLLGDSRSLRHLWRAFDRIDDETAKLEGLLDGIRPIQANQEDPGESQSTLTQLADMTVGCLTKGGYSMSSTLEQFLKRDTNYDPSRACLMLVATAASAISDDSEAVAEAMGKDYRMNDHHFENTLWPIRCLLQAGVSRNNEVAALLLLNATLPDELRRRPRGDVLSAPAPSMKLCKALVLLIVSSSPNAAEYLLSLVDEQSRVPYWESLHHETRLELSLISIGSRYPMLLQTEVRTWAIDELLKCIESQSSAVVLESEKIPSAWLQALVLACLENAGAKVPQLVSALDQTEDEGNAENLGPLHEFSNDILSTRSALVASPGSGGLDFDVVIPALLILEQRSSQWHDEAATTTRSVLDAVCYLAGRRNVEEPLFPMNSATLMRECFLARDVRAGANLVGGKNGLVLECCHLLVEEVGMTMDEAEAFLLATHLPPRGKESSRNAFDLGTCHLHILWLLREHVLSIRTYGEFETTQLRGKVDPVAAATLCFRTWWKLTFNERPDSSEWLIQWLRHELHIVEGEVSPYRLACAALTRALAWPDDSLKPVEDGNEPMARRLDMSCTFLIELAQSCCGLVEALPPSVAEDTWKLIDAAKPEIVNLLPAGSVDESFASTASSITPVQ